MTSAVYLAFKPFRLLPQRSCFPVYSACVDIAVEYKVFTLAQSRSLTLNIRFKIFRRQNCVDNRYRYGDFPPVNRYGNFLLAVFARNINRIRCSADSNGRIVNQHVLTNDIEVFQHGSFKLVILCVLSRSFRRYGIFLRTVPFCIIEFGVRRDRVSDYSVGIFVEYRAVYHVV